MIHASFDHSAFTIPAGLHSERILTELCFAEAMEAHGRTDIATYVLTKLNRWLGNRETRPWNILCVAPGMERKVAAALGPKTEENRHGAGLQVYVPIERYRPATTWRSRTRPLMPGYVLALLRDDDELDLARKNHAVREVMCREGRPVRLSALDVGSLILFEAWGMFDRTWESPAPSIRGQRKLRHKWERGQRVRVTDGPFAGFPAEIQKAERADRMEVFVTLFGRVTPVTLDEEMIESLT